MTTTRFGALQIIIVLLTLATALIHLWLGIAQVTMGIMGGVMFLLNAAGYVGLIAALYLNVPIEFIAKRRSLVRIALVVFAAITILGWAAIGARNEIGFLDKAIEVLLIILLVLEARQE
ncbi:MAG: hypothetical protein HY868_16275 [Chloroflexi bacterium]|nr:hypothetical protein [Chloroflexota bacterium]